MMMGFFTRGPPFGDASLTGVGKTRSLCPAMPPPAPVSGFRLDAIPVERPNENDKCMSWSADGDFVLTELRVEALSDTNTNIARGARVKASHLLPGNMTPAALTDGMPSTYAHPWQADLGPAFFFEIDLGRVARLDRIGLRGRGDSVALERCSRLVVRKWVT